jgi:hypothetical protein
MRPMRLSLILAFTLAVAALAQTSEAVEQFSSDRPGFTASPSVLGQAFTQVEAGVTVSVDTEGDLRYRTLTFGSPLIRMGLGRSVELRFAGDGIRLVRSMNFGGRDLTAGWSDVGVGAKFAVVDQGRILPAISLMPSISIPAGNRALTSTTYDPSLEVAWLKTLPAGLSLGGTFSGTRISDERVRHARYTSAVSFGFPAPARSAGYVEIYAVRSGGQSGGSTWVSDAGITRQFGANLQIDVEAGRRISHGSPCWFVATGFALRHSLFRR